MFPIACALGSRARFDPRARDAGVCETKTKCIEGKAEIDRKTITKKEEGKNDLDVFCARQIFSCAFSKLKVIKVMLNKVCRRPLRARAWQSRNLRSLFGTELCDIYFPLISPRLSFFSLSFVLLARSHA